VNHGAALLVGLGLAGLVLVATRKAKAAPLEPPEPVEPPAPPEPIEPPETEPGCKEGWPERPTFWPIDIAYPPEECRTMTFAEYLRGLAGGA
jgi:hypothetical protein